MAEEQQPGGDVDRVLHALKREREAHKETTRLLAQTQKELQLRIEALESRPPVNMAGVSSGLAEIRRDLRAELAELRQELSDLAAELHQFTRN